MQNDNYIVVFGWMCNELGLSGTELLVFALIYGFTQDGETGFLSENRILKSGGDRFGKSICH